MTENEISTLVVDAAIEVHRVLGGPGLLEGVYEEALAWELTSRGLMVERQKEVPIRYKSRVLGHPLKFDLRVNGLVLIECKATTDYNVIYEVQLLTYLRLLNLRLGMVINFGEKLVKAGIHRVVNRLPD